ncbi:HU family DNA-binding protein [Fusobacterium ulcerans]|uniref:HU family DNA-binding protein n=1 Tax=Fusobacterium ulcerans TaxID=861 RepID=UPI00241F3D37|nr:HU family DNA-binding protein [Fusobacterium ulcerans]
MNRKELAKLYQKMSSEKITITKAREEIEKFLETVEEAIAIDGEVKFQERGIFEILTRQPRMVSNPVTREQMEIYPKKTVKFRASKKMK